MTRHQTLDTRHWALSTVIALVLSLLCVVPTLAQTAVLLPNGRQQFLDANGNPLASGTVGMYIPSTLTSKTTWQDAGQVTPNVNPVPLDSAGTALIYGNGTYRQLVKDALGNTIWDALTTGTPGPFPAWGGTSTGSGNTPTIVASSFTAVAGSQIAWRVGATNTGPVTLTIGATPYSLLKPTTSGPSQLAGGELTLGNVVTAMFDSVAGAMILLGDSSGGSNELNAFYQANVGGL